MTQGQRWGTDQRGVPRLWFAPFVGLVALAAPLLFQLVVHSRGVTPVGFASALTFALVFTVGLELNRRRLQDRQVRNGS